MFAKITVEEMIKFNNMSKKISNKIYQILTYMSKGDTKDTLWGFEVHDIEFRNEDKAAFILVSVDDLSSVSNLKEVVIPYRYFEMKDHDLRNKLTKFKDMNEAVGDDKGGSKDSEEYREYLRLKKKYEKEKDKCVICGIVTNQYKDACIDVRDDYVEGIGQLCSSCYKKYHG